jgi:hypothetical protein
VKATPRRILGTDSAWSNSVLVWGTYISKDERWAGGQLTAPELKSDFLKIFWDSVPGASEYLVEESQDSKFDSPKEVYRGPANSYTPGAASGAPALGKLQSKSIRNLLLNPPGGAQPAGFSDPFRMRRYRVKATGVFTADSNWSNSVSFFG